MQYNSCFMSGCRVQHDCSLRALSDFVWVCYLPRVDGLAVDGNVVWIKTACKTHATVRTVHRRVLLFLRTSGERWRTRCLHKWLLKRIFFFKMMRSFEVAKKAFKCSSGPISSISIVIAVQISLKHSTLFKTNWTDTKTKHKTKKINKRKVMKEVASDLLHAFEHRWCVGEWSLAREVEFVWSVWSQRTGSVDGAKALKVRELTIALQRWRHECSRNKHDTKKA